MSSNTASPYVFFRRSLRLLALLSAFLILAGCFRSARRPNGIYFTLSSAAVGGHVFELHQTWFFTPDGRVYFGAPTGGPEAFDWNRARKEHPHDTGTYQLGGDQIIFHWADGRTDPRRFSFLQNGFILDNAFANPMQRFEPGQRLSGTYGASATMTAGSTTVSNVRFFTFKPDGTFSGTNTSDVDVHGGLNDKYSNRHTGGTSNDADSGYYRCGGYTMEFKHASGQITRCTAYIYPSKGDSKLSPGSLSVDGVLYTLSKK